MRNNRFTLALIAAFATALLASCGGHGNNDSANIRLINATLTHASISLIANSSAAIGATPFDTVSAYASVPVNTSLQINDATTGTALKIGTPTTAGDQHYGIVAYESGGAVQFAVVGEDTTAPSSGTVYLRIFDAAPDAGAVDVYVVDAATDISTVTSPTVSFAASTTVQGTAYLSFAPGTYQVLVTGAGNQADVRLDIPSVTLTDTQLATVILTPTTGGTLANGGILVQQGAYTAARNTNARVRLAAAVTPGAVVAASASSSTGTTTLSSGFVAPAVGAYLLVPGGAAFNISVNGTSVAAPGATLAAGSDVTLLVYGDASAATASLVADDNHLTGTTSSLKVRLLNGITGTAASPVTLSANYLPVEYDVVPGTASGYAVVAVVSDTPTELDVSSSSSATSLGSTSLNIPGDAVYTVFMLGDVSAPSFVLRRDR